MKLCRLAIICLASLAFAESSSVQLARAPGGMTKWTGNHLVDMQGSGTASIVFRIYNRDGSESRTIPLLIPGADHITPADFSMNAAGRLAAVGTWLAEKQSRRSFLAVVPPSGQPLIIDTGGYNASAVTIGKTGEVWTFGLTQMPPRSLLRQWDDSGDLTEFPLDPPTIRNATPAQLEMTRHGLYLFLARDARLIHIEDGATTGDVQNIELRRGPFRNQVRGPIAVTDEGSVCSLATIFEDGMTKQVIVRLDASARRWFPMDAAGEIRQLYGADGAKLVSGTWAPFELKFTDLTR